MKDSFHYPMLSSMQHSHYTPAKYTLSPYTPTHYAQRHYTSSQYTPRQYTPTRYTRTQCSSTRYTTSDHKPSMASVKPARTVHFPNDVVFQDHIRQGDLEQIGRFIRARKVRLDTIYLSGMAALHEAVLSGNLECVKLLVKFLLSQGASMEVMNESGEKPVDLIDPECKELVRLF
ncbi:protein phosphatase 1 regulatory subunit 27-like, partial [Scleropages formosus]